MRSISRLNYDRWGCNLNGLDLFTGSGIGSLAFKHTIPDYRTVCYVEWEPYCQAQIISRIADGVLDDAPIWDDIRSFDGNQWRGKVDIITGGFPCQPFSVAGKRKGEADERNMWPDTIRVISEVRPRYALLENVPGLFVHEYIRRIFGDLAESGYDAQWLPLSAAEVGAPHRRERQWILAYSFGASSGGGASFRYTNHKNWEVCSTRGRGIQSRNRQTCSDNIEQSSKNVSNTLRNGQLQPEGLIENIRERSGNGSKNVSNTQRAGLERADTERSSQTSRRPAESGSRGRQMYWWSVEPDVGRVVDGLAFRVDRLKTIGNGWVPSVVRSILQVEKRI